MKQLKLHSIQSKVFNLIKSGSLEGLDNLLESNINCSTAERIAIYQEGYRIRLREALEDDFPSSLALWPEDIFEIIFERFASEIGSESFSLNLVGKYWLQYLENSMHEFSGVSKKLATTLLELTKFEWKLSEVYFKICHPLEKIPEILIDEETRLKSFLTPAIGLHSSPIPVHQVYLNKKVLDPSPSYFIVWNSLPTNESVDHGAIKFESITENEYLIWDQLLKNYSLSQTQLWMDQQSWSDSLQESIIGSIFEFATANGILKFIN